nr:MAG TPA: hypothetical protein [Caudoviricetes sp.]DAZ42105.1 MAG TPA: hypothetical protein [Caudoviricetes sp.]
MYSSSLLCLCTCGLPLILRIIASCHQLVNGFMSVF